jgi:hypothetical protein
VTPGQLSIVEGLSKLTATDPSPAWTVSAMTFGGQAIIGGCVSTTVTVKAHVD